MTSPSRDGEIRTALILHELPAIHSSSPIHHPNHLLVNSTSTTLSTPTKPHKPLPPTHTTTMGWFSNSTEKSTLATHPVNPDITTQYGSGAEQDRYGQHFGAAGERIAEKVKDGLDDVLHARGSGAEQDRFGQHLGVGSSGYDKAKDAASRALHAQGNGAEQDRYGAHFSTGGRDPVRAAALDIISAGGDAKKAGWHGLGHDGWERAKILATQKGTGAEQVCCCVRWCCGDFG
jgi:hypothetical protein